MEWVKKYKQNCRKNCKKLAAFVLLAVLLVGMMPEREIKAEEISAQYSALEYIIEYFNWEVSNDFVTGSYAKEYPYFIIYKNTESGSFYLHL